MSDAVFGEDLAWSNGPEARAFYKRIYRNRWPNCTIIYYTDNRHWQALGIDCEIYNGIGRLRVDEKLRRKDYGDVLIEFISDVEHNAPGWACKPLPIHMIAYGVMPAEIVYWLHFPRLQKAYKWFGRGWKKKYPIRDAHNTYQGRKWVTRNVCVPLDELEEHFVISDETTL